MSETGTDLVVSKPLIKICLNHDWSITGGGLVVEFNKKLTFRGSDFRVFANTGFTENTSDSPFLVSIMNALMTPDSGIEYVEVRSFSLQIHNNSTTIAADIMQEIDYAAQRAGFITEMMDNSKRR